MSLGALLDKARDKARDAVAGSVERAGDPAWVDAGVARLRALKASEPATQAALAVADVLEEERELAAAVGHAELVDLTRALDLADVDAERAALDRLRAKATLAERLAARDAASAETRAAVASDVAARRLALETLLAGGRFALHLLLGIG